MSEVDPSAQGHFDRDSTLPQVLVRYVSRGLSSYHKAVFDLCLETLDSKLLVIEMHLGSSNFEYALRS